MLAGMYWRRGGSRICKKGGRDPKGGGGWLIQPKISPKNNLKQAEFAWFICQKGGRCRFGPYVDPPLLTADVLWHQVHSQSGQKYSICCNLILVFQFQFLNNLCEVTCDRANPWLRSISYIKGALDKYNIILFIFNSIENFIWNQYWNLQLILPMRFHFMGYFVNSIICRVSHRLLYCVFIEVDFEK